MAACCSIETRVNGDTTFGIVPDPSIYEDQNPAD
jgi:hypothetical protein